MESFVQLFNSFGYPTALSILLLIYFKKEIDKKETIILKYQQSLEETREANARTLQLNEELTNTNRVLVDQVLARLNNIEVSVSKISDKRE